MLPGLLSSSPPLPERSPVESILDPFPFRWIIHVMPVFIDYRDSDAGHPWWVGLAAFNGS